MRTQQPAPVSAANQVDFNDVHSAPEQFTALLEIMLKTSADLVSRADQLDDRDQSAVVRAETPDEPLGQRLQVYSSA